MGRQYKAVLFDLDGTILDTSEGVLNAVVYTIRHFGFPLPENKQLKKFIGPPIQTSFAKTYNVTGHVLQEMVDFFRKYYKDKELLNAKPYDGIYEVFEILNSNHIHTAIATYKREDYAIKLLKHFNFHRYTNIMYGADNENRLKKSDIMRKALSVTGIENYAQAVMVGDSDNDAIGAKEAGCVFLGVTYGFGFETSEDVRKYSNIGIADNPLEIAKIIVGE